MRKKYFIITVDTEGDNQWDNTKKATTENAKFLPRFQELSNKYCFYPTWLVDYEMAHDENLVSLFTEKLKTKECEVGMHLHAWSTPPEYSLERKTDQRAYLIEYPQTTMAEKIHILKDVLEQTFLCDITSHRSGRWSINQDYFDLLDNAGFIADCSVTPHKNWARSLGATGLPGTDFTNFSEKPYMVTPHLVEVPMTIREMHHFEIDGNSNFKNYLRAVKHFSLGKSFWLRPNRYFQSKSLKTLINHVYKEDSDYVMFMIHSSELMPGGSPSFPDVEAVNQLYSCIDEIYSFAKEKGYEGITLSEYAQLLKGHMLS